MRRNTERRWLASDRINLMRHALLVAAVLAFVGVGCGEDPEMAPDSDMTNTGVTRTAYVEVKGMVQQLGIT